MSLTGKEKGKAMNFFEKQIKNHRTLHPPPKLKFTFPKKGLQFVMYVSRVISWSKLFCEKVNGFHLLL